MAKPNKSNFNLSYLILMVSFTKIQLYHDSNHITSLYEYGTD